MTWVDAVQRYSRLVLSVPRRFGLRGPDAEDVLQNTWQIALDKREEPPPEEEFVRWIVSIAFWTTRGFLRDAERFPELMPGLDQIEPAERPSLRCKGRLDRRPRRVCCSCRCGGELPADDP